ncbi:uncharacterized protein LOC114754841 [Neltuma alba]|uniref:uncharacterized protein LOC114754841 n=1 Tax=Neltuma alba TaxID=207710 RepID=UPI0010A53747|nr:uncharacterized protein LOC114754841 [Prosopis alba]
MAFEEKSVQIHHTSRTHIKCADFMAREGHRGSMGMPHAHSSFRSLCGTEQSEGEGLKDQRTSWKKERPLVLGQGESGGDLCDLKMCICNLMVYERRQPRNKHNLASRVPSKEGGPPGDGGRTREGAHQGLG